MVPVPKWWWKSPSLRLEFQLFLTSSHVVPGAGFVSCDFLLVIVILKCDAAVWSGANWSARQSLRRLFGVGGNCCLGTAKIQET